MTKRYNLNALVAKLNLSPPTGRHFVPTIFNATTCLHLQVDIEDVRAHMDTSSSYSQQHVVAWAGPRSACDRHPRRSGVGVLAALHKRVLGWDRKRSIHNPLKW